MSADGSTILLWSPDSSKILMWLLQHEWGQETGGQGYDLMLAAVDLHLGMFSETTSVPSLPNYTVATLSTWPTNEGYILGQTCGEVCDYLSIYTYYDYSGQTIANLGVLEDEIIFTPQRDIMIGFGRGDEGYTVNEINLSTFQVRVLWEKPLTSQRYFVPFAEPSISPNEQFIAFYFGRYEGPSALYIIDRDGREYGQYANSYLLDWGSSNDLIIREELASGEYRLVYHSLAGRRQILLTTEQFIYRGQWSSDGRFFAFNLDKELYIWQPGYGEPQLVYTTTTRSDINLIAWLPDSRGLYFMVNSYSDDEIWLLTIETYK
jgi:hypothetical protein